MKLGIAIAALLLVTSASAQMKGRVLARGKRGGGKNGAKGLVEEAGLGPGG